jgi:dUTPase
MVTYKFLQAQPTRGSAFAAGYDIYAAKETVIPAKGKGAVDTGIRRYGHVQVPSGTAIAIPVSTAPLPLAGITVSFAET